MTAAASAGNGTPINTGSANVLTVAVYGDAPYGTTPTDTTELDATPAFIDSINSDPKVDLVLHVGDIHSGKQYCTEAYDRTVFDLWKHNPLSAADPRNYMHPGYDVPNFHRIVVHGSTLPLEWLRLTIDPRATAPQSADAFGPFSWTRVIP
jgi:hypothetical protein